MTNSEDLGPALNALALSSGSNSFVGPETVRLRRALCCSSAGTPRRRQRSCPKPSAWRARRSIAAIARRPCASSWRPPPCWRDHPAAIEWLGRAYDAGYGLLERDHLRRTLTAKAPADARIRLSATVGVTGSGSPGRHHRRRRISGGFVIASSEWHVGSMRILKGEILRPSDSMLTAPLGSFLTLRGRHHGRRRRHECLWLSFSPVMTTPRPGHDLFHLELAR